MSQKIEVVHQPIVEACEGCPKIFDYAPPQGMIPYEACSVYINPKAIQSRMGSETACGVKPAPEVKESAKKMQLKKNGETEYENGI
jgi:hypothetical protein